MKVVIATPLYPPAIGGPATYARHLADELGKRDILVKIVAYGRLERALPAGVRHLAYLSRLVPALSGADACLALDTWSVGIPALIATRLRRVRLVVRIGGDFLWESYVGRTRDLVRLSDFYSKKPPLSSKERIVQAVTGVLLRHAEALAFNSAWQRDLWQKAYRFDAGHASVIENFFPLERGDAPATARTFVAATRIHPLKNYDLLERVFDAVRREYPDIVLDTRPLPPAAHHARLRDCYAVIVASISEASPNLAIDAVAAGKPFIAPQDSGGYSRMKNIGSWVDTRDAATLEGAIRSLLDPTAYDTARSRIRAFAYAHPWAAVADEFIMLFS